MLTPVLAGAVAFVLALVVILLAGVVLREEAPRLLRPMNVAMILAVVLLALHPHLWPVFWTLAVGVCVLIVVVSVVAGVVAEMQRCHERRRR